MLRRTDTTLEPRPLAYYLQNSALNNFNLLRLIAAIAVVFGHSFALCLNPGGRTEPVVRLVKFGYSGSIAVDIFFLISGIFVSQSLYFDRNYFRFLLKRTLRIWPGLVICLVLSVLLAIAVSPAHNELLSNPATYTYIIKNSYLNLQWGIPDVFDGRKYTAINGSLWTLPLEAKMYFAVLLFGFSGILYSRLMLMFFATLLALLLIIAPDQFAGFFDSHNKEALVPVIFFLAGMAIFALRGVVRVRPTHIFCVLLLALVVQFPTFEILGYVLIAMITVWFGCSSFVTRLPKLRGDYSYGVYIYSFPIQQLIVSIWPSAGPYEVFAAATLAVMPCAILSWYFVELPAQLAGKSAAQLFSGKLRPNDAVQFVVRQNWRGVALPVITVLAALLGLTIAMARLDRIDAGALGIEITAFGPNPVIQAQSFNIQPNGKSAIWVQLNRPAGSNFVLVLAGEHLETVVRGELLTAAVPPKLFGSPGSLPLFVESVQHARRMRSNSVEFIVK
jgi:peptidoglycan/LPS O-acetylase OafA/YrhL